MLSTTLWHPLSGSLVTAAFCMWLVFTSHCPHGLPEHLTRSPSITFCWWHSGQHAWFSSILSSLWLISPCVSDLWVLEEPRRVLGLPSSILCLGEFIQPCASQWDPDPANLRFLFQFKRTPLSPDITVWMSTVHLKASIHSALTCSFHGLPCFSVLDPKSPLDPLSLTWHPTCPQIQWLHLPYLLRTQSLLSGLYPPIPLLSFKPPLYLARYSSSCLNSILCHTGPYNLSTL
jgi:hypothetical protein